jgi:hypothetical protein
MKRLFILAFFAAITLFVSPPAFSQSNPLSGSTGITTVGTIGTPNQIDTSALVTKTNAATVVDSTLHDAKVDSTIRVIATDATHMLDLWGVKIPNIITTIIAILVVVLPMVQLILKRIPSPVSVKIGGIVGKVLDLLTWFQPDNKSSGGTHSS